MKITTLPNGNLEMIASPVERKALRRRSKAADGNWLHLSTSETWFIENMLPFIKGRLLPQYRQVRPEDVGALTDAPLISDGKNVHGFMNYQVESFLETLAGGKPVVWQKG